MKIPNLKPLLLLTLGWFGIEMALALDATQFQVLLDQHLERAHWQGWALNLGFGPVAIGKATLIGLVLSFGPLAGIIVQPLMGWLGDYWLARGISRALIMKHAVFYSLACTLLFTLNLPLWALVMAIGLFFVAFNVVNVNYRAMITEISNRKALVAQKGMVSGFIALFSGLGGFCMFMLFKLMGNSPWPAAFGALILCLTFFLVFRFAPKTKPQSNLTVTPQSNAQKAQVRALLSPWHLLFYVLPMVALIPFVERKLAQDDGQKTIFRLFLSVFFAWLGIQALRAFFILLATKDLHVSYENANLALAVLTLVMVCAALPLGALADKLDNRLIFKLSLAAFALTCLVSYWVAHSLAAVMVMSVLLGVSFAGMIVMPLSMLFKFCPRQSEGVYSGLYNLFISMPQLYSLFITGWLVDYFHSYRLILMVGAVTVIGAALLSYRLTEKPSNRSLEGAFH